jgi:two-component system chemotaxis response regulator CheB
LLAVDDNADSAELVGRIGQKCGYDVRVASKPSDVRELLVEWKPDVITLDLCMPDSDAIDLFPFLQQLPFVGAVLIISGHDDWMRKSAGKLASARGLHVAGDMQKPLDTAALRQVLQQLRNS